MGMLGIVGFGFTAGALLFMIVAFASPYWVESFEEFKGTFVKLGLWEFCFNDYTFYKDYNGKRYLGCFYVFSPEIRPIWEWVSPPWFVSVQVMVSASLLFIFLVTVALTLNTFKLFPKHLQYALLTGTGAAMLFTVVVIFIALVVFGVYKEDRLWIPRPDMNLLSWSYGLCCVSGWLCLFAGVCLLLAGKEKKDEDRPKPYM
ncbi:hypothetical protein BgiMline_035630 [Biomphalaria glabrata]|uniref:Uncharacterized protein LOC106052022 n=2 Tax=Biomphalaria TaxID=6525 RepID=A0A2C9M5U0_BIOGL|nr:uncharacterized protein LOC106052022 [Biomphalaria glabrata]KAI8730589.1 CAunnamed protein product [Biomphalaria glabrata]KAI8764534.1 CAunnamed protein product [Biomphalaria glabrata]KAK0066365.1 hypothetical protein Bpfe_004486 [Biomphalaria pfeifferi]